MVEETKKIIGHIGLDDYRTSDGVSMIFSQENIEDKLFKGMFVVIKDPENKNEKFFGQILDEPKSIPVTGRTDNPLNEYPILHQETVQYVPEYKKVSQIRILGKKGGKNIVSNFTRPKPASKVYRASQTLINDIFNVGKGKTLGRIIGYDDSWISISFDDIVARKQLGIFGTTGSGKSNTTLRIAEMYAEMDWCVFILDYLGEYVDCKLPNNETKLFNDARWASLGIEPKGYDNTEVFAPKRDWKSKCDTKFFIRTMDVNSEVVYNLIAREEAQQRKLSEILSKMRKKNIPIHLKLIKDACFYKYGDKNVPQYAKSSYWVMYERIRTLIGKSVWDDYYPPDSVKTAVKKLFDKGDEEGIEYEDDFDLFENQKDTSETKEAKKTSDLNTDIEELTGIKSSGKVKMGEDGRLDVTNILKNGKINVFNFKNSTENDYRATTLYILSELFRLKKEKAESIKDLPKVLILIEEAHIPFSKETNNYLANIMMDIAKKVFKIGRHYFLNMCVVTQRPMDVHSALLSQINTRIIHRLKTKDDINRVIVGDIEEFKSTIPRLSVGEAMIDSVEWVTPLYIQVAPSKAKKIDINYE